MSTATLPRVTRRPARSVTRLGVPAFRVAMAFVLLAVAVDAFVAPNPGTSAGDHLVSGLVPLAVGTGLMWVFPRLAPGWRGAVAISCGGLAVAGAVANGSVTALAGGVAGVVLIALGLHALWSCRRPGVTRKLGKGVLALLGAFFVLFPIGMAIVATNRVREAPPAADLGRPYESVSFRTSDGLTLHGWYVPSRNGAAVIAFPGREGPVRHARMLARHGYGVLLLDRRGEGASEGDFNAFGWGGVQDLHAALSYLQSRGVERIGGLGLSVGGELMLQAAGESGALRAVVSEGAGVRSIREHLEDPTAPAVLEWASNWTAMHGALLVLSDAPAPPNLAGVTAGTQQPLLLIRGGEGNPDEVLNEVYARAPHATLWTLPEAGHTGGLSARPREYEQRVIAFFDEALR
jgi:dienelactone hydrolase